MKAPRVKIHPGIGGVGGSGHPVRLVECAPPGGLRWKKFASVHWPGKVDAIRTGCDPVNSEDQVVDLMDMLEAVYRSSKSGWEVVR